MISEVGPGVVGFRPGSACSPVHIRRVRDGDRASCAQVRKTPRRLTDVEAASIPVCFITAWIALMEMARVAKGTASWCRAPAGGVGSAMVQVASRAGRPGGRAGGHGGQEGDRAYPGQRDRRTRTRSSPRTVRGHAGFRYRPGRQGGAALKESLRRLAPGGRAVSYGVSSLV